MNGASDRSNARAERRRLRDERRTARRQCDSLAHAVRGPVTLITLGILFALNNFKDIGFDKTWPVLLIVFGLFTLIGRSTQSATPDAYAGAAPPPPPPAYSQPWEQTQPGGYRQSGYANQPAQEQPGAGAPAGTAKGGFGSSAPQSPKPEQGQTPPEGGAQ